MVSDTSKQLSCKSPVLQPTSGQLSSHAKSMLNVRFPDFQPLEIFPVKSSKDWKACINATP